MPRTHVREYNASISEIGRRAGLNKFTKVQLRGCHGEKANRRVMSRYDNEWGFNAVAMGKLT
jgi:hypothetical protein